MEYSIHGFSQEKALELGLDDRDLLILRWFINFRDNGKMATKIIKEDKYYWIDYQAIIEDLPIMNIKSADSVYRRLKKMAKVSVLKHETVRAGGVFSYLVVRMHFVFFNPCLSELNFDLRCPALSLRILFICIPHIYSSLVFTSLYLLC